MAGIVSTGGRRRPSPGAWRVRAVVFAALLLGVWIPLAPGAHAALAPTLVAPDHRERAGHCDAEKGAPGDGEHRRHPHDESDCPVCVHLAVAKRAGLPGAGATLHILDRLPQTAPAQTPSRRAIARLGREGKPRAPPRAARGN